MSAVSDCDLKQKFEEINRAYTINRDEIEKVKTDFEMMIDGWNINFAVDFFQIHNFLHPKREKTGDTEKEHKIWLRAAGTFLFSELEEVQRTFILPPHLNEFKNHLIHLKRELLLIKEKHFVKEEHPHEDFLEEDEREMLEEAKEIYSKGEQLSEKLMNEILDLINAKFLSLYKLVSGRFRNEIAEINDLFDNKRISTVTGCWDKDVVDLVQKEAQKSVRKFNWYNGFKEVRPRNSIIASNVRDARAIQIIIAMNEFFREKDRKEVVYIVSDAESMEKVLNWDKFDDLNWKEEENPLGIIKVGEYNNIRILRDSRSFLVYLLNRSKSENKQERRKKIIENLTARQKELDRLAAIRGMIKDEFALCREKCDDPQREKHCRKIQDKIEKFEREYKKTNLFKMISQSRELLEPYISQFRGAQDRDMADLEDVESLIDFLLLEKEDFEKRIREKTEELETKINRTLSSLRSDIVRGLSFDSFRKMNYKLRRLRGIPYQIKFENAVIKDSLKEFSKLMDTYSEELHPKKKEEISKDIRDKWKEILELTENESLGLENRLLLALVLFSYKFYHDVIGIKSEVGSKFADNPKTEKEFLLLECLANYRLYRNKKVNWYFEVAKNISTDCTKRFRDDPRFINLSAILKALPNPTEESIRSSLSLLERARTISETNPEWNDNHTKSTILNNIVFINLTRKDLDLDTIVKAEKKLKKIKELHPRKKWDFDMLHTEGFLLSKKAMYVESPAEKKELLKRSIDDFRKARKMAIEYDLDEYRIETVKEDMKKVKDELKNLNTIET